MKLYYTPGACSLACHIAATEGGLDLELDKVDLQAKKTEKGQDYLSVNPKGAVPALEISKGEVLTENQVILQYLADKAGGKLAIPASGMARWHFLELLNFIATELHKGLGAFWNPQMAPARDAMTQVLSKKLDFVEKKLDGNDYLTGKEFTIADGYAFTVLNWAGMVKFDLSKWPKIQAFQARVAARPGVQKALKAEGLA
jgi:glutathione S-transferase